MRRLIPFIIAVLLSACAAKERIVLLPGPDGTVGAVVIRKAGQEVELKTAYAAADIGSRSIEQKTLSATEVKDHYANVFRAQPVRPHSYNLYFVHDQIRLMPESQQKLEEIKQEIQALPAPELIVIGHTDRVGDQLYNDGLSLRRAEHVRAIMVSIGIPRERIEAVGRGERDPLVPTRDEVAEPKNRRVQIKVR